MITPPRPPWRRLPYTCQHTGIVQCGIRIPNPGQLSCLLILQVVLQLASRDAAREVLAGGLPPPAELELAALRGGPLLLVPRPSPKLSAIWVARVSGWPHVKVEPFSALRPRGWNDWHRRSGHVRVVSNCQRVDPRLFTLFTAPHCPQHRRATAPLEDELVLMVALRDVVLVVIIDHELSAGVQVIPRPFDGFLRGERKVPSKLGTLPSLARQA
jgi:hypothetical protein